MKLLSVYLLAVLSSCATVCLCRSANVTMTNEGEFVMKIGANYVLDDEEYELESDDIKPNSTGFYTVPDGATDITIEGLVYIDTFRLTRVFQKWFTSLQKACYRLWGTARSPGYAAKDC